MKHGGDRSALIGAASMDVQRANLHAFTIPVNLHLLCHVLRFFFFFTNEQL